MGKTLPMTEERLLELIAAYGAETGLWPERAAAAAAGLLASPSPAVRAARDEAQALDAAIAGLGPVEVPGHLAARILDTAPRPGPVRAAARSTRGLAWLGYSLPTRASAAFASLALGLTVGYGTAAARAPDAEDFDAVMSAALGYDLGDETLAEMFE